MRSTRFGLRVAAVASALMLVFSGATAFAAATQDGGSASSTRAEAERGKSAKCKKKSKKCTTGFVPGRVVELRYESSAIGGADTPAIYPGGALSPINFIPGTGEELATIEIIDDFSPNASVGFSWDSDGDGLNDTGFDVCGSTPEPVTLETGVQHNVFPYLLPSTSCSDGVATSGTIIVTFNKI
jgi:hypothetical protein